LVLKFTTFKMANVRLENIKRRFNNVTSKISRLKFLMDNFGFCGTIGLWQIYGSADDRWAGNQMGNSTLGCSTCPRTAAGCGNGVSELRSLPSYERGSKHRLRVTDAKLTPTQFENG